MKPLPFPQWRVADRLIRAAGVPYEQNTRQAQHQLVRMVAQRCAELGTPEAIRETFGDPDPQDQESA